MKNFKMKDLMVTINPKRSDSNALYNCENHSTPDHPTGCTNCTHQTTGDGTNCTNCTHNTTGDETNCTNCTHVTTGEGTGCTNCTHNTTTTCIPHTKGHKDQMSDSIKATELSKLKKAITRLQENEYA
jgi:hypothetical protein